MIEEGVKLDNLIHDRTQRAHRRAYRDRRLHRRLRQHHHRQTLHDRRHCGFAGHLTIADDVVITGYSMVSHSIERPGVYSSGIPIEEAHAWRRMVARFKRLGLLDGRVRKLEQAAGLKPPQEQEQDDD